EAGGAGPAASAGAEMEGGDVAAPRVGARVVPGEGAVRAGTDEDEPVAGERLAGRGDRRGRMDGGGRSAQVLDVVKPRLGLDGGKPLAAARLCGRECGCDDVGV